MKIIKRAGLMALCAAVIIGCQVMFTTLSNAEEKDDEIIRQGVSIDAQEVGGMTYEEAEEAVEEMINQKSDIKVSITINKEQVETTLKKLGYHWANKEVLDDALNIGKSGNIIRRYKDLLDLEKEGKKYSLEMEIDEKTLKEHLEEICKPYNVEAKNASLKATGSGFEIVAEKEGCVVDYDTSSEALYKMITDEWDGKSDITFTATTKVSRPEYTAKDCEKVSNTPMGSYYTTFSVGGAYDNRNLNIKNGAEKLDGNVIYPGERFSCNEHLAPWTEDNGWHPAGTYVDGGVEDSLGGGICQVSSTLYNALLRAEIKVVTRFSHSMSVSYVDLAADAALAGDYKDLVFENDTDAPIYIQGVYEAGRIGFNVYGHDTRAASHSVKYESKLIDTIPVKTETVKDPTKPEGYSSTESSGHVGYVAELWKITYENGEEVSRELLHTSKYAMTPTKVVKGTAKAKPADTETTKKKDDQEKPDEKETTVKATENTAQVEEQAQEE